MGTINGLPYPEPTDPVANGATAIKNLATALAPVESATIAGSTGWTAQAGPNNLRLRKEGKEVMVFGALGFGTGAAYASMFTVPAAYLPPSMQNPREIGVAYTVNGSTLLFMVCVLNTNGVVGNSTGTTGSLPASGVVRLGGLHWYMD